MDLFAEFLIHWAAHTFCTAVAAIVFATRVVVGIVANAVAFVLSVAATECRCFGIRV